LKVELEWDNSTQKMRIEARLKLLFKLTETA